jgi:streptogramin lyase
MWLGADNNGLNHLFPDGRVEYFNQRQGLPGDPIFSVLEARDGSLWVGFRYSKLAHIRGGHVRVYFDHETTVASINALCEDRDGSLWVGYWGKGLAHFEKGRFHHLGPASHVTQMAMGADGALWAASDGEGLYRYFQGALTHMGASDGLTGDHFQTVYTEADGSVWAGGANGLSLIRGGRIDSWTTRQGLAESMVGSIVADDLGNLWFGGDAGIYSVSKQELARSLADPTQRIHPVHYGTGDGLRSRETLYGSMPSAWKDRQGRLWFATIRGAARIDPAHIPVDRAEPLVWIEHILFDSRAVDGRDGLTLGRGTGNLEVAFSAPVFATAQAVHFRYRLMGFDPDWIDAGTRRTAWYTNLPPGEYTFVVKAQSQDGEWSRRSAVFHFELRPPFYRTLYAYILYAVAVILLGWLIVALRTRALLSRHRNLAQIVAERTAQLQAE